MPKKNTYITDFNEHLGAEVRNLRVSKGISGQKLGEFIGVSAQQLHKYEIGANNISVARLALIAKSLGKDIPYFYEKFQKKAKISAISDLDTVSVSILNNLKHIDEKHKVAISNLVKSLAKDSKAKSKK